MGIYSRIANEKGQIVKYNRRKFLIALGGNIMCKVYGYVRVSSAEQNEERQVIVRFGRPESVIPDDFESIIKEWENKCINIEQVLKKCKISKSTFYRKLHEVRMKQSC